jgi:hypothetical protein
MRLQQAYADYDEGKIEFAQLQSLQVEMAEHVKNELLTAAKHIPVERLGATDDCGFSPFSRDVKPKHGSPDFDHSTDHEPAVTAACPLEQRNFLRIVPRRGLRSFRGRHAKLQRGGRMQYAMLIYETPGSYDHLDDGERAAIYGEYMQISSDPACVGGAQLEPIDTASTVRVNDGETLITDGPFADTKEVFGGYFIYEADDLDTVLEVAARIPATRMGGSVEVRPVVPRERQN